MARTPRPEGWQGGSEDFTFVRTLNGHIAADPFNQSDSDVDADYRRNALSFEDADLGGA